MTEQTEWEKLREKIAKLIHDEFEAPTPIGDRNWQDFPNTLRPRFYQRADQILADFKASFPALAKEEGLINPQDYEVIIRKLDSPEAKELLNKERYVKPEPIKSEVRPGLIMDL